MRRVFRYRAKPWSASRRIYSGCRVDSLLDSSTDVPASTAITAIAASVHEVLHRPESRLAQKGKDFTFMSCAGGRSHNFTPVRPERSRSTVSIGWFLSRSSRSRTSEELPSTDWSGVTRAARADAAGREAMRVTVERLRAVRWLRLTRVDSLSICLEQK
jgi:hypothetical protein